MSLEALKIEVTDLQRNIGQVNILVERLDTTIDKLSDLSNHISKLLAVHEHKFETQEKQTEILFNLLEKRKQETEQMVKDIRSDFDKDYKAILAELKEMRKENRDQYEVLDTKIKQLEKFVWVASGAVTVIIFLLTNGDKIAAFLGI